MNSSNESFEHTRHLYSSSHPQPSKEFFMTDGPKIRDDCFRILRAVTTSDPPSKKPLPLHSGFFIGTCLLEY